MYAVHPIIDTFFSKYTKLLYKRGEIILRAGDSPNGALYLKKGLVRMSFAAQTGDALVLHVYKAGSVFPMPWIVNSTPNRYYFEALTPVELWRAPQEDVMRFFRGSTEMTEFMMSKMLTGLSGLLERMEYLVFDSAYRKVVLLLLYYAKNFTDDAQKGTLIIPLTHKEIAAWIGTTRETASIQVELLKRNGLIRYDKRSIIIPSIDLLKKEIERGAVST
jgi:CRP-like cAMP-binding protein